MCYCSHCSAHLLLVIASSVRTRHELFADEYSPMNTARSSASSQYSGAGRPSSNHDRRQNQNQKQKQKQRKRQQLNQQKSRVTGDDDNDDNDDDSDRDGDGDTMPLASPCKEQSARNFDDDDSSKEEVSVDKASFWPQSGYADESGGGNGGHGCDCGGGGGDGYRRGSSGGSATAEDSWNTEMGRALDDDTPSTSRIGSSGRSSSRSGARRPSRRYLVEQNRLRSGW